jgi:uncharacterized protein YndB with AHSA1/START domain
MRERAVATRSIELDVTVEAPVEAVWKALSQGDGLEQWFPPHARVEPGVGGKVWLSWGPGMEGEGLIQAWEPNRRIAWAQPSWGEGAAAVPVVVDFTIEARGGSTVVRLVHSGFGVGADWDEMFDATKAGWTYFLFNLAHYLLRHRGEIRRLVFSRRSTTKAVAEVWNALLGKAGFGVANPSVGGRTRLRLGSVGPVDVRVQIIREPHNFAGVLESLNDGLIFVELEPGAPSWHCGVWISLYGIADEKANAVQAALDAAMDGVLPAES